MYLSYRLTFAHVCKLPAHVRSFMYTTGSHSLMYVSYWLTFAHVCKLLAHILSCMYATGSHSRMCMCCCLTFFHVHVYAIHTFVHLCDTVALYSHMCMLQPCIRSHVCRVASHSPFCVCCNLTFAHVYFTPLHSPQSLHITQYVT